MIELDEVDFRYADQEEAALSTLTLRVDAGEVVAVLGPNGAGKSTLMRLVAGGLRPARGSVRVAGRPSRPRSGPARPLPQTTGASTPSSPRRARPLPRRAVPRLAEPTISGARAPARPSRRQAGRHMVARAASAPSPRRRPRSGRAGLDPGRTVRGHRPLESGGDRGGDRPLPGGRAAHGPHGHARDRGDRGAHRAGGAARRRPGAG